MKRTMMQVYVKGSVEAVELYQKAFNATLSNGVRNSDNTFLHAELNVCGNIIICYENKALIIKRDDKDDIGAGTWECVGGKIDFGEELEQALIREVQEEVGLNIIVEKLLYATTFKTEPSRQVVILAYKCKAKNKDVKLSEEHSEYRWVSKEEFKKLLHKPIIVDMDNYNIFSEIFND